MSMLSYMNTVVSWLSAIGRQYKVWPALCVLYPCLALQLPVWGSEPDTGVFLVAKPGIADPRFLKSVVLVTRQESGSTIGVIINQPTEVDLKRLFPDSGLLREGSRHLYLGGPVMRQRLVFLVRTRGNVPIHALRVFDNVFLSDNQQVLHEILRHPVALPGLRVFSGYTGWAEGQLQAEVARGDWFMLEADTETLFQTDPVLIWQRLIDRVKTREDGVSVRYPGSLRSHF